MCENWKYHRLSEHIKKQSICEMKHAEVLIERILFLDGTRRWGKGRRTKMYKHPQPRLLHMFAY
jgi:bacterioferritin (cytochrome b1)